MNNPQNVDTRSIAAAMSVGGHRPKPAVSSQLHTPLAPKKNGEDSNASISNVSMAAVKREVIDTDPLAHADVNISGHISVESSVEVSAGISSTSPKEDPFVADFLKKSSVTPVDCDATNCSPAGLQQLARSNAWKKIAEISHPYIGQEHPFSITFKLRATALFRMKMFDDLAHEVATALQDEESAIDKCDDRTREFGNGTEKVIALHLLLIEVKSMTGRGDEALTQLYILSRWLCGYASTAVVTWWKWRVLWAIVNNLVKQRQWRQAIRELQSLLGDIRLVCSEQSQPPTNNILAAQVIVMCRLSRLFVQIGGIHLASIYSRMVDSVVSTHENLRGTAAGDHAMLSQALVCFSRDQVDEAINTFEAVMQNERVRRENETVLSPTDLLLLPEGALSNSDMSNCQSGNLLLHPFYGVAEIEDSVYSIAANNFAICCLHMRRINRAIETVEQLLQEDIPRHALDPVVFNLCTMYDLSCSPDISSAKKRALQDVISAFHVEDLHWRSFRLS